MDEVISLTLWDDPHSGEFLDIAARSLPVTYMELNKIQLCKVKLAPKPWNWAQRVVSHNQN